MKPVRELLMSDDGAKALSIYLRPHLKHLSLIPDAARWLPETMAYERCASTVVILPYYYQSVSISLSGISNSKLKSKIAG